MTEQRYIPVCKTCGWSGISITDDESDAYQECHLCGASKMFFVWLDRKEEPEDEATIALKILDDNVFQDMVRALERIADALESRDD